jgi:hypothetical protein
MVTPQRRLHNLFVSVARGDMSVMEFSKKVTDLFAQDKSGPPSQTSLAALEMRNDPDFKNLFFDQWTKGNYKLVEAVSWFYGHEDDDWFFQQELGELFY